MAKAVDDAIPLAQSGHLVTFGIVARSPHIGYGYVKRGQEKDADLLLMSLLKNQHGAAEAGIASGEYYWNSGMFLFRASQYLKELKKFRPEIYSACEASMKGFNSDLDFLRIRKESFIDCPNESVDYAVMENTGKCGRGALWMQVGATLGHGPPMGY